MDGKCQLLLSALSHQWLFALAVLMLIILLLAGTQNLLYILLYIARTIKRNNTSRIYFTLSIMDFLIATIITPLHILPAFVPSLTENCHYDQARKVLSAMIISSSSYTICLLSFDRYLLVRFPYEHYMHARNFFLVLTIVIFVSISIPLLRTLPGLMALHAYYGMTIINSTLIVIALTLAYANLIRILRSTRYNIRQYHMSATLNKERRVAKSAMAIVTLFIAMLLPMIAFHIAALTAPHRYFLLARLYVLGITSLCLNAAMNPLIYYLSHAGIRNSVVARVRSFSNPRDFNLQVNQAPNVGTTLPSDPHEPGQSHSARDDSPPSAGTRPRSGIITSVYSPTTFKRIIPTPSFNLLTSSPFWPDHPSFLISETENPAFEPRETAI